MVKKNVLPTYTLSEELINSISHGIGTALSITALVLCVVQAALHGNAWGVVSSCVYGASLIILYCMSTLYHAITNKTARTVFRVFDHTSIFFLIAGTYTPITFVTLNGALGWTMFGIVWGAAVLGIVLNSISIEKFKKFSMICYIGMGWAAIIGIKSIFQSLPTKGFVLLILGGVLYTVGIIFYALKKFKYMHCVWHFFVLAGSILHFFCIYLYVLPVRQLYLSVNYITTVFS